MVEMIAAIKPAHRNHLHRHADDQGRDQPKDDREHEAAGERREGRGEIGADHVERAVRQIHEIHDPENQRQTGRQQEQQQAELEAVQELLDEK